MAPEMTDPGALTGATGVGIVASWPAVDDPKYSTTPIPHQRIAARRLADRYHLTAATARLVAELAGLGRAVSHG